LIIRAVTSLSAVTSAAAANCQPITPSAAWPPTPTDCRFETNYQFCGTRFNYGLLLLLLLLLQEDNERQG